MRYRVTCSELVFIDRTYEVEAESLEQARILISQSKGSAGFLVDGCIGPTYRFRYVYDDAGKKAKLPKP